MCSHWHVNLYLPANFVVIRRKAPKLWRHIHFSKWRPYIWKFTSGFRFGDCTHLRRWKSIQIPNYGEICQPSTGIKLLSVSENGSRQLYFRFPYWPMCSHMHVILHLLGKFRSNQTNDGWVMTSYRFFKMAAMEAESGFRLADCTHLRMWKSICTPNSNKISQSTAEIKLRPVSENGRPPYWILLPVCFRSM